MSTLQVFIVVALILIVVMFVGWIFSVYISITRQMEKIDKSWDEVSKELANRFEVLLGVEKFVKKINPDEELLSYILRAKNAFARSRQKRSVKSGSNGEVLFHDKLLPTLLSWVEDNEDKISKKEVKLLSVGLASSIKKSNRAETQFNHNVLDFRIKTERFPYSWISKNIIEAPKYQIFNIDEEREKKKFTIVYKGENYAD